MKKKLPFFIFFLIVLYHQIVFSQNQTATDSKLSNSNFQIQVKDAPLKKLLTLFAEMKKKNLVIPEGLNQVVSAKFNMASLDQALSEILSNYGYGFEEEDNSIKIISLKKSKPEHNDPRLTKTINLKYSEAQNIKGQLEELASSKGKIIIDERSNTVTIRDFPNYVKMISHYISKIDKGVKQVQIKTVFVEISRDYLKKINLDWQRSMSKRDEQGLALGYIRDLDIINAEKQGFAQILTKPVVVTQDRRSVDLRSGVEFYFADLDKEVNPVELGIEMSFTPQVNENNYLTLDLEISESEPDYNRQMSGMHPIIRNQASAQVTLLSGQSFILGGLFQIDQPKSKRKIGSLRRKPLLGEFYKKKSKKLGQRELLVIITPQILN